MRYALIGPAEDGGFGELVLPFDRKGNPIFNLYRERFDCGGRIPLCPHALDVLFQLLFHDLAVHIVEVCREGEACYVAKPSDRVALGCEENCWDCCDE
jgi:hypothetical protein